ncbi:MAG: helix-turn-helix domain-containing protein [Alphaproteobacteria bacterium]|nr:helix-turn-helix domain-containing protein [Alphaproteobacteria bacterium]
MSHKHNPPKHIFAYRLKEARQRAGLSQKQLGIAAGIDEFVASTRINRYEQGVHEPDIKTASSLAKALNVPLAYLFAEDNRLAVTILKFNHD